MDTGASIVKAMLAEVGQKLLASGVAEASERPRIVDRNGDRMAWNSAAAILRESPRVCGVFGRGLGSVIVIVALLASRRAPGRLWLGVSIGLLGGLKYFGYF